MEVSWCRKMTEIVAHKGDYHQTIVFGKLKCLELSYLDSLTNFCPGSYTFNFPCLEEVVVEECPKLMIFSDGVLSTPQLQSVKQGRFDKKECWVGDLNTTTQQCIEKDLTISDTFPELEIWQRNPQEILELQNITKMEFYKCSSLEYIFTSSMLLSLKQLESIEVKECSIMEQVIREDEEEATTHELKFPRLISIEIKSCSNLTNFYLGSRALKFPKLRDIWIDDCPKMTALSSSISRKSEKLTGEEDVKDNTTALFCDKVDVPSLEMMTISKLSNVKMIFHTNLPSNSFQSLRELSVSECEILKNLFPASIAKHLLQLEDLSISDCGVEEIVSKGKGVEDQPVRFEFPKVSSLEVTSLKELKCFYKRQHTIVWPMLKKLTADGSALLRIVGLEDVRLMQERKGNGEAVLVVEEIYP
ncbi:hypothetical protein J1N35_036110 [Gossypium stocksii]|uniref:Disease resistance protein At4g27190-like leucine-rich repeats domain-containing protein n=1 Tax=Gossypium stocksii TaxID=47602 RepID=A0A9D3UHT6_9ROSI|nr:hypothetical protein J1N35_036110 [Gossypium stocksii]